MRQTSPGLGGTSTDRQIVTDFERKYPPKSCSGFSQLMTSQVNQTVAGYIAVQTTLQSAASGFAVASNLATLADIAMADTRASNTLRR